MNKLELEKKLQEEKMTAIYDDGIKKNYIDGEKLIVEGIRKNMTNVFGVYKGKNNYVAFITDNERGLPYYIDKYETEDEACSSLYDYIVLLNRIHQKTKTTKTDDFGLF